MMKTRSVLSVSALVTAAAVLAGACAPPRQVVVAVVKPLPGTDTIAVPLNELGRRTYHGLEGGLYEGGALAPPPDYHAIGLAQAIAVRPLAVNGVQSAAGKYVLMSVGGTDASATWCSKTSAPPCNSWTVAGRAVSDPSVNHSGLVIVNGAIPGSDVRIWASAADPNYNRIRDTRLAPLGLSENQVQAIWMMVPDSAPNFPLVASPADAGSQLRRAGETIRALKSRYPNLRLLLISSPASGGFSPGGEPGAYESGFVVKWVIQSQIARTRGRPGNADVGDVGGAATAAPWISWGPYFWSSAGARGEFDASGANFSESGQARFAGLLFEFFKSSPYTRCWFLWAAQCG